MRLRTTRKYILIFSAAAALALSFPEISLAAGAEKWREVTWSAETMASFDALCLEAGLTSSDVLEANGYSVPGKNLPRDGDGVLVPSSKGGLAAVWFESGSRNGGAVNPLITVKLHGVPSFMRGQPKVTETPQEEKITQEAPPEEIIKEPAVSIPERPVPADAGPEDLKNFSIVVSGDEIVLRSKSDELIESILRPDPSAASRDIIIPNPPKLTPVAAPPRGSQRKMIWPVDGKVSSGFGRRGVRRMHAGLDIPMPAGTPIAAAQDGVVLETATNRDRNYRGYGNVAVIDHGNGIVALYAHCSKLNVKKGQKVRQGEIVAFVGRTGRSTTNHLHFEIRKNGSAVNPTPYLIPR